MRIAGQLARARSAIAMMFAGAACALGASLLCGCASSEKEAPAPDDDARIAEQWRQPAVRGASQKSYGKVFVVGVAHTDELRRQFEDEFVRQLQAQGVQAIASHTTMPPGVPMPAEVVGAVRASGSDGVIVTRLLKREQWRRASFAGVDYQTHYSNASQSIYAPQSPLVYRSEVVTLETRLFDAAREQMVWATETELFDPRATSVQVARLVRALVKDLKQGALI